MLASLSENTIKQYGTTFKLWWLFCSVEKIDPLHTTNNKVIQFLTDQFHQGASYGTMNSHRSALSLLLSSNSIGADERIKRVLKGAFKLKPSAPRYSTTWDPQIVINHISNWAPNNNLSIEKLTKKLVILLALCTAHRVQTLSLIHIENIHFDLAGAKIVITSPIKTSGPGREQPVLFLPYFKENLNICPVITLKDYLTKTESYRQGVPNLLLTYKPPFKKATAQTISRWIKTMLSESGIDTATFKAHSTRHASTSAARAAGVSIDAIRKTAGWTSASFTFARYYNRPIVDSGDFAKSVCLRTSNQD